MEKIIANDVNTVYRYKNLPLDSLLLGLTNGTIDIGLSPLTITSSRSRKFDFSTPYYVSHSTGVTKKITALKKNERFISSISIVKLLKALGF